MALDETRANGASRFTVHILVHGDLGCLSVPRR